MLDQCPEDVIGTAFTITIDDTTQALEAHTVGQDLA